MTLRIVVFNLCFIAGFYMTITTNRDVGLIFLLVGVLIFLNKDDKNDI
jgi:hypothetical protein